MSPTQFREETRRLWEMVPVPAAITAEIHPGEPAGQWVSISLTGGFSAPSLLFLHLSDGAEVRVGYGEHGEAGLNWSPVAIDELPQAFLEFVQNFHESLGSANQVKASG